MLNFANISLSEPFFQAPLSGYSDYPMRKLARSFGATLTFAGVMLAKSAANPKVLKNHLFIPHDDEHPIGAQILGDDPKIMVKAAMQLQKVGYDIIDLNFACPAPKVLRRHRGGYLLNDPQKAVDIYNAVRDTVDCPVTVKLRIGYDNKEQSIDNFWHIVSHCCKKGVDALTIHGRTVTQKFRHSADWQVLAEVKREFPKTIIIGSGDLFDASDTVEKLRVSGLDGVAVARGAIGNPWIFSQLKALFEGNPLPDYPTLTEQAKTILKHFEWVSHWYEKAKAVRFFRKFLVNYCKLHPHRRKAQKDLLAAVDHRQLLKAIENWYCPK